MIRFLILGVVIAVAFTLYSLVDAAMADARRARGVSKPVWVVLTIVLPVIGGLLWFIIGRGPVPSAPVRRPDDDPRFSGTRMGSAELDAHMRELEERLRELDEETFPGEASRGDGADDAGATGGAAGDRRGPGAASPGTSDPGAPGSSGASNPGAPGSTGTSDPGAPGATGTPGTPGTPGTDDPTPGAR